MSNLQHVGDEALERYALSSLSDLEAEAVEDHIALCQSCLDRLDDTTAYVTAMRSALSKPEPQEQSSKLRLPSWLQPGWSMSWGMPVWAGSLAAAAGLAFFLLKPAPGPLGPMATVLLDGTRGDATIIHGTSPFDFEVFMPGDTTSTNSKNYHAELLDQAGHKQWEGEASGQGGKAHAIVRKPISTGQYFLDVTDPATGSHRQFALSIEK